ncbi:RING finger protein 37-like [Liolophura sinensis]|uniref:RING finger protein 37-like n=1 Tax=Liolophura sinensis TaxID=3198878 RepID=UPI0031595AB8
MINFCHGSMTPDIKCDKVCADEYGVENLIAGVDYWASQRGFRAESFIVPPVSVTVRFPCNIQIARIILDPVVGRQKSCGFEIFASSRKIHKSPLIGLKIPRGVDVTPQSVDEEIFGPVGKEALKEPCIVCFENSTYRPRKPFDEFIDGGVKAGKLLRRHRMAWLSSVSAVTIRIVNTVERSAPALKRLEIWGQPAQHCPEHLQTTIYQIYREATLARCNGYSLPEQASHNIPPGPRTNHSIVQSKSTSGAPPSSTNSSQSSYQFAVDVPEEFIDPITCEIMTVPLTLPSGKTIDQLTLDKHINAESTWGRSPSDPFTGVPFCELKKPIPNVSLKLRIDRFVLAHSAELRTVPRVLGRGESSGDSPVTKASQLLGVKRELRQQSIPTSTAVTSNHYSHTNPASGLKRKYHDMDRGICTEAASKKVVKLETSNISLNADKNKTGSHESNLSLSLNEALHAALGGLPSFQSGGPNLSKNIGQCEQQQKTLGFSCIYCHQTSISSSLYTLACDHLACRKCLTKAMCGSSSGSCQKCGKSFISKDVVRFNT